MLLTYLLYTFILGLFIGGYKIFWETRKEFNSSKLSIQNLEQHCKIEELRSKHNESKLCLNERISTKLMHNVFTSSQELINIYETILNEHK